MPRKDPFKAPGAVKFQLVHRSQRDPLIHDPEASQNIFKPLDKSTPITQVDNGASTSKEEESEAAKYGVYFDDSKYDYMQHLRTVGEKDDTVESILLPVPGTSKSKSSQSGGLVFKDAAADIPAEFLPPKSELPGGFEAQRNIPTAIAGFRPDMNPHLRQTLEALEDEAFVDDGLEDDFFAELVEAGEVANEDDVDFPFDEEGIKDEELDRDGKEDEAVDQDAPWEDHYEQFKKSRRSKATDDGATSERGDFLASEGGDTIGTLPAMSVLGIRKRRKKSGSQASGYSMSSSSMFRNAGLTLLDEQFEQVLDQYENAHDIDCDCEDCEERPRKRPDDESATDEDDGIDIHDRDDLEGILDEFLNKYEIIGRQLVPVMEGDNWDEKLTTMRKGAPNPEEEDEERTKRVIKRLVRMQLDAKGKDTEGVVQEDDEQDRRDRWDCETILSTYSNMENHPRIIRARDSRKTPKIRLDPVTGMPIVGDAQIREKPSRTTASLVPDRAVLHDEVLGPNQTLRTAVLPTRSKDESKEDKAARKHAVKEQKQARRTEKKVMKETFTREKQLQVKVAIGKQMSGAGLKKL